MKLFKAEVTSNFDPLFNQGFKAIIEDDINKEIDVIFTSPYADYTKGGFAGHVPEVGTKVILCELDNTPGKYYFLATPFEHLENTSEGGLIKSQLVKGEGVADNNSSNHKINLTDPLGSGLPGDEIKLQNRAGCGVKFIDVKTKNTINERAELYTSSKRVTVNDTPFINSILLDADTAGPDVARIELTGDDPKNLSKPHHSLDVLTTGSQSYVSEKEIVIVVNEGDELNIVNNATGFFSPNQITGEYGNVNIQSSNNGINLFAGKLDSPIPKSNVIRLETLSPLNDGGGVVLKTNPLAGGSTIELNSGGDIHITSNTSLPTNTITLNAFGHCITLGQTGIDMFSTGEINLRAAGNINIDGSLVNLNSNLSTAAPNSNPAVLAPGGKVQNTNLTLPYKLPNGSSTGLLFQF